MSLYRPRDKAGKTKSPYWHFDFIVTLPNGDRRRFSGSTGLSKHKDAKEFEDKKRKEAILGTGPGALTVNQACWKYWEEYGKNLKGSVDKAFQLEVIRRLLGSETRLVDLTKDKIAEAIRKRAAEPVTVWVRKNSNDPDDRDLIKKEVRPLSGPRINRSFIVPLRALLIRAEGHWDAPINPRKFPWRDWLYPEAESVGRELSESENDRLWPALRPDYHPLLWFIANNGLRTGGALSMLRSRTNLERRETYVKRKTKKAGIHWVKLSLSPAAVAVLQTEMKKHNHDEIWTYLGIKGKNKGTRVPITYSALRRAMKTAFGRAEIKDFRLHDFRHDFGSKLLRLGKNLKLVQDKLHHSSIVVTARFYSHVTDDDLIAGTELVEASRNITGTAPTVRPIRRRKT